MTMTVPGVVTVVAGFRVQLLVDLVPRYLLAAGCCCGNLDDFSTAH